VICAKGILTKKELRAKIILGKIDNELFLI